ncbi:hypothetical protein GJU40_09755 [Bacillus lacus]|uniref:ABC transporter substrate-binding protein n=1 Tax=Metabacillus lacus TaxID=1983721 RepID=A0A7X2IZ29_9BACI|nr:ABC transporter substrate-binding protein [Metabacillus lacus]MRX72435.1 hypothetical protein [Metabacillus lacus]
MDYWELRVFLHEREQELSAPFTQKELASLWSCTEKNVKRKLQLFQKQGSLSYLPGLGRGNSSSIKFHSELEEEILSALSSFIAAKKVEELVNMLQLPFPKTWLHPIADSIQALFGMQHSIHQKDILRSIFTRELTTLDPLDIAVTFESFLASQLGDTLLKYDAESDGIAAHTVHHWRAENNDTKFTLYLRKRILFHHGLEMTSKDVLFTLKRFQKSPSPYKWMLKDVKHVTAVSPYIIEIELGSPDPFFLRYLTEKTFIILPHDREFAENEWIASGPFRLKEYTESKLVLLANEAYFDKSPLLDGVEFWRMPRETARELTFDLDNGKEYKKRSTQQEIETGFRFIGLNMKGNKWMKNPDFRRALYHLMDAKKMWRDLEIKEKLIGASTYFYWLGHLLPVIQKSEEQLLYHLEKSGYNGEKLTLYSLPFQDSQEQAIWLITQAARHGIQFEHHLYELSDLYTQKLGLEADAALSGEVASSDPLLSFIGAFHNEALLFKQFIDEDHLAVIQQMIQRMKSVSLKEDQQKVMLEIETYIQEHCLYIYTHHPLKKRSFHPMIREIASGSYGYPDLCKLWISR